MMPGSFYFAIGVLVGVLVVVIVVVLLCLANQLEQQVEPVDILPDNSLNQIYYHTISMERGD